MDVSALGSSIAGKVGIEISTDASEGYTVRMISTARFSVGKLLLHQ